MPFEDFFDHLLRPRPATCLELDVGQPQFGRAKAFWILCQGLENGDGLLCFSIRQVKISQSELWTSARPCGSECSEIRLRLGKLAGNRIQRRKRKIDVNRFRIDRKRRLEFALCVSSLPRTQVEVRQVETGRER